MAHEDLQTEHTSYGGLLSLLRFFQHQTKYSGNKYGAWFQQGSALPAAVLSWWSYASLKFTLESKKHAPLNRSSSYGQDFLSYIAVELGKHLLTIRLCSGHGHLRVNSPTWRVRCRVRKRYEKQIEIKYVAFSDSPFGNTIWVVIENLVLNLGSATR